MFISVEFLFHYVSLPFLVPSHVRDRQPPAHLQPADNVETLQQALVNNILTSSQQKNSKTVARSEKT
jgi:hypothetical protein